MPEVHPSSENAKTAPDVVPGNGPTPHEDLTIAEEIDAMRLTNEHRPGQQCFRDDGSETRWVDDGEVDHFIREEGARHSSDYKSIHGTDWQTDFFNL